VKFNETSEEKGTGKLELKDLILSKGKLNKASLTRDLKQINLTSSQQ